MAGKWPKPQREAGSWSGIWARLFGDVDLAASRTHAVRHYTVAVLTGLASMSFLEGPAPRLRRAELELLKETLLRELRNTGEASPEEPGA